PSTSARLRVWPCQVVATRQWVFLFAGSILTPSIRANRSSTLMPLTTVGATVFARPSMAGLLSLARVVEKAVAGSLQGGERCLNTLALALGDQAGEHLAEMRMPGTRMDVLPAIGRKEGSLDRPRLVRVHCTPAMGSEVARVGGTLLLQDSVYRGHEFDEVVDRPVAFLHRERGVVPYQLEFVEDGGRQFFFPVIGDTALKPPGQLA